MEVNAPCPSSAGLLHGEGVILEGVREALCEDTADCHPSLDLGYSEDDTWRIFSILIPSHFEVWLLC